MFEQCDYEDMKWASYEGMYWDCFIEDSKNEGKEEEELTWEDFQEWMYQHYTEYFE
jgi:hypothetical protein